MGFNRSFVGRGRSRHGVVPAVLAAVGVAAALVMPSAPASASAGLTPEKLLVSISVWTLDPSITAGVTMLPPGCSTAAGAPNPCTVAQADGTYPIVFNNDGLDGSFGVTQPIVLDELNPANNKQLATLTVPTSTSADHLVTSFSSKSEIALNLSTLSNYVTFMGYVAPLGGIDVSNSNTPGAVDPTNSGPTTPYYRAVAQLDRNGNLEFTETNAYSGNNGRAGVLNDANGSVYMSGNAGNGANPEPEGVVRGVGSQILRASTQAESAQNPGAPTPLGNFNILQLPANTKADKSAKDDNFRGLTINGNTVFFSKGSGGNGIDTVYFLDTTGAACPGTGVGVPQPGATLPSAATFSSPTYSTSDISLGLTTKNPGLAPTNVCVLNGFPTVVATNSDDASLYPFGIWFANPTTMYVADEGAGDAAFSSAANQYTAAAASTTAGLQKWTFDGTKWNLDYTLQNGLNLGTPYAVANDAAGHAYPTGTNSYVTAKKTVTGPWTPAVDGLRNLTGRVNDDATVTLWASTSTVSFSGDQGADPNALLKVTDNLSAKTAAQASGETFSTVMSPTYGQVVRGVSFTPGTKSPLSQP